MIDLHIHSTASDGQYHPADLVKKVKGNNIDFMALTDHDSVGGIDEAVKTAEKVGIVCIPGIEISIRHEAELHMLGYGVDIHAKLLTELCEELVHDRDTRTDKIVDYLEACGIHVTREEIEAKAGSDVIGRPHFARVMMEKGYVESIQEAFDKYLATPEFAKIERPKPTAERGLSIIKDAGGIAVLAHPCSLKKTGEALDAEISKLVKLGLDGIETYYSTHTKEQVREYHVLAEKYHLIETAGSDFHGEKVKPTISLGHKEGGETPLADASVEEKIVENLCGKLGICKSM